MRFHLTTILTAVIILTANPIYAANTTRETWQVSWPGHACTMVLTYDKADLAGPAKPNSACRGILSKVRSFVYTDEQRNMMILFRKTGARGAIIGQFDKLSSNRMKGQIGDGTPASMMMSRSSSTTINLGESSSNSGSSGSQAADCIQYSNRSGCARKVDLKNPKVATFQTVNMRILSRLKVFPFSGGNGFAQDQLARKGSCVKVKTCEQAFSGNSDWCEIVLPDGFFTGWVKRQDEDFVYMKKGC